MNKKIILLFVAWRILDFLTVYLAPLIIPYLGFFPYKEVLSNFNLPHWINSLANFDGIHYLLIASQGYSQWEQAFFPVYPVLIKLLTFVINNGLLAGLFISNLAFFIGLLVMDVPMWFLIFILAFPTSFFFGAVYTEGLFFLFFALTLYFLKKEKYLLTGISAILTSLTRLVGVFLIIPIALHWLSKRKGLMTILTPLIGLGIYCFYLWKTTGDALFFLTSQPVFGANRSSSLVLLPQVVWRYIKIFATAAPNFQYFISLFEFSIFMLVFIVLILDLIKIVRKRRFWTSQNNRLALNLFSVANLVLPTLTGTFSSVPRYALFSLSFFFYLTEIKNVWAKIVIALVFLILHVVLLGFFSQGYFIS